MKTLKGDDHGEVNGFASPYPSPDEVGLAIHAVPHALKRRKLPLKCLQARILQREISLAMATAFGARIA
jgi:hypothetical protein